MIQHEHWTLNRLMGVESHPCTNMQIHLQIDRNLSFFDRFWIMNFWPNDWLNKWWIDYSIIIQIRFVHLFIFDVFEHELILSNPLLKSVELRYYLENRTTIRFGPCHLSYQYPFISVIIRWTIDWQISLFNLLKYPTLSIKLKLPAEAMAIYLSVYFTLCTLLFVPLLWNRQNCKDKKKLPQ